MNYYMNLPYSIIIKRVNDESGRYYFADILELDGCHSHGNTPEEAYKNVHEAMEGWLKTKLDFGDPIPEPKEEYSGRINLRMPKSLHQKLAIQAEMEGVSLNQYMIYKLSQ
ncbi:antitoxin HicB [Scopulibacillus daqui]|uniref:Antitoxin HicB n=1 Tax=Scopulibacillus daqui TaxID=1469162 RepID=A0ABS2PWM7_9BACL|nr:antitoxin HicB [Scopulibacillus daqui]